YARRALAHRRARCGNRKLCRARADDRAQGRAARHLGSALPREEQVMQEDARTHAEAAAECDIILKGGITSGIVYPSAIATLATHYRLRSIGGTSAGAIAASAAAAAELGRASGAFEKLAALPAVLGETDAKGRTRLFRLFQPQRSTKALFHLLVAGL